MKSRAWMSITQCVLFAALAIALQTSAQSQIITFDAPGAGTGPGQGTFLQTNPGTINPAGAITGFYCDAINCHGFLRAPDGTFNTFDAPGSTFTFAGWFNPAGVIAGNYADASSVFHGYLRARNGTFTTFDAPDAGTGAGQGTFPYGLNPAETIVGSYVDVSNVNHGFLRARDGTIISFDAPGAGGSCQQLSLNGTIAQGINPAGAIAGYYFDASGLSHGYLRARDGTITTFDAPGAGTGSCQGTIAQSINPAGAIAGYVVDANNVAHGFLRSH
jgi:hypothetical protein